MKFIKLGAVCVISAVFFAACVKKEEPKQIEPEPSGVEQLEQPNIQPPEQEYTTLEEISAESDTSNSVALIEESAEPAQPNTTTPSTRPNPITKSEPIQRAVVNEPENTSSAAEPARDTNTAASIDDAVAEAMKAAQPAIQ